MALNQEQIRQLANRARRTPSMENWRAISETLAALSKEDAVPAVNALREPLKSWPAQIRRENIYSSGSAWLKDLFQGLVDPRLELVGWADIYHKQDFEEPDLCGTPGYVEAIYPVVKIFARALDPSFDPPDTVLSRESDYTAAAGCGGGFDSQKRGNDTHGMEWYDKVEESPSGNDPSTGDWSPYGLAGGYDLHIGRHIQYQGHYTFSVSGPPPKVYELAHAWGALLRQGRATPDKALAALAESQKLFQNFVKPGVNPPTGQSEQAPAAPPLAKLTLKQIVAGAASIASDDQKIAGEAASNTIAALEQFSGDEKQYRAGLKAISQKYPNKPPIQKFVADAQAVHDHLMSQVYKKIINPLSGTPCCPQCKSVNIGEGDGAYEFTLMRCGDCGYEEMCDIYQQGDWYV